MAENSKTGKEEEGVAAGDAGKQIAVREQSGAEPCFFLQAR
jgi:hypothetical protein